MILGEGPERPRLEPLVQDLHLQDEVVMPGFVKNPYKYMKNAAVFVLSSKWEGLGNVVIEALAVQTPVVSTDCPSGPSEILENGRWGTLVPVDDGQALARGIIQALKMKGHADTRKRALDFTVDQCARAYAEILA